MTESDKAKTISLVLILGFLLVGVGGIGLFALDGNKMMGFIGGISLIAAGICGLFFLSDV